MPVLHTSSCERSNAISQLSDWKSMDFFLSMDNPKAWHWTNCNNGSMYTIMNELKTTRTRITLCNFTPDNLSLGYCDHCFKWSTV